VIQARPKRRYKSIAAHIVGYTAPVTNRDIKNGYDLNDMIGKTGTEAIYEDYLKGDLGWKMVEVNVFGQTVRDLPLSVKAEPGESLILTIDLALQKKAEELLEGKIGAVVVMDPRNGEILAMASKPDFDPNYLKKDWNELASRKDKPLLNRSIMGEYPPGSTFKIITATTALQENKIGEHETFYCKGRFRIDNWRHTFRCHKASGHGYVGMEKAIAESCNVYFYNLAYRRGVNVALMHKYSSLYGLGKRTGVDLPGEVQGFVPEKRDFPGDKISLCIGQGKLLVTPIQMLNVISVMANRGFSYKPRIVKQPHGSAPELLVDLRKKVSPRTINIIRNGLKKVVERGNSRQANLPDYHTAGKTGSAQNPFGDEHSWFIGFGPFDNPEIAIAVLVENGGRGSQVAAPIAGQIFAEYFYKGKQEEHMLVER